MTQPKKKIEYVDEFRKFNAIEKLPPSEYKLSDYFEEKSVDNNKFLRLKKEPVIEEQNDKKDLILKNKLVKELVENDLREVQEIYKEEDMKINSSNNQYMNWSQKNIRKADTKDKFKFFYLETNPPPVISGKSLGSEAYNVLTTENNSSSMNMNKVIQPILNKKEKYDFQKINEKIADKSEKDMERANREIETEREEEEKRLLSNKMKDFKSLKTLKDIFAINEFSFMEKNFRYQLDKPPASEQSKNVFLQKFIYNSTLENKGNLQVEYFRDIGLPSRNLDQYTELVTKKKEQKNIQAEQDLRENAHYLHLLKPFQLNIQKSQISFYDLNNIATKRTNHLNVDLCLRSDKPTRNQVEKLYKRLQKYNKIHKQRQNELEQYGVGTQEIQQNENYLYDYANRIGTDWITKYIQELIQVRKQLRIFENSSENKKNVKDTVKKQFYTRMENLINKIYSKLVDSQRYPIYNLKYNIEEVNEQIAKNEDINNKKILWFILDYYDEIIKNIPKEDNFHQILHKQPINNPIVKKYKGNKLVQQKSIGIKNLYVLKDNHKDLKEKSKTPTKKIISGKSNLTPTKKYEKSSKTIGTQSKTTTKKFGQTKTPTKRKIDYR